MFDPSLIAMFQDWLIGLQREVKREQPGRKPDVFVDIPRKVA